MVIDMTSHTEGLKNIMWLPIFMVRHTTRQLGPVSAQNIGEQVDMDLGKLIPLKNKSPSGQPMKLALLFVDPHGFFAPCNYNINVDWVINIL